MEYKAFIQKLALEEKGIAITRIHAPKEVKKLNPGCALASMKQAMQGERIVITMSNSGCGGSHSGFGLCDDLPNIPGGFGHFLSYGRGEGFPPGERVKVDPETAEAMLKGLPQQVNGGFDGIEYCPYEMADAPDLVSFLVNPDQLSALIHIFCFKKSAYDNVIMPMTSGCASVVRIPLGEMEKGDEARAVVGNVDIFSRPHFPKDTFFFTVPAYAFKEMLQNADESVLASPIWNGVKKRL